VLREAAGEALPLGLPLADRDVREDMLGVKERRRVSVAVCDALAVAPAAVALPLPLSVTPASLGDTEKVAVWLRDMVSSALAVLLAGMLRVEVREMAPERVPLRSSEALGEGVALREMALLREALGDGLPVARAVLEMEDEGEGEREAAALLLAEGEERGAEGEGEAVSPPPSPPPPSPPPPSPPPVAVAAALGVGECVGRGAVAEWEALREARGEVEAEAVALALRERGAEALGEAVALALPEALALALRLERWEGEEETSALAVAQTVGLPPGGAVGLPVAPCAREGEGLPLGLALGVREREAGRSTPAPLPARASAKVSAGVAAGKACSASLALMAPPSAAQGWASEEGEMAKRKASAPQRPLPSLRAKLRVAGPVASAWAA
jgi:hypothetical protein